jgi:hypothetical protein
MMAMRFVTHLLFALLLALTLQFAEAIRTAKIVSCSG